MDVDGRQGVRGETALGMTERGGQEAQAVESAKQDAQAVENPEQDAQAAERGEKEAPSVECTEREAQAVERGEALHPGDEPGDAELALRVRMTTGVLYDYMIHHTYTSAAGILGTCFGAAGLLFYLSTHRVAYLAFGIILILYLPLTCLQRAALQMRTNPVFREPLDYRFTQVGITVAQGEFAQSLPWEHCVKAVSTRRSIVLYTGRNNASIFPRSDLGDALPDLIAVLARHMEPKRVKIRF